MDHGIAIVGATGFIGKEITNNFQNKGINLHLCSKNGGEINGINVDKVDLLEKEDLMVWLNNKNISSLLYLSSEIPTSFGESDWDLFNTNLQMNKTILDCWVEKKYHLIYSSSCSLYGQNNKFPWDENEFVFPDNYYTLSKLVGELFFLKEYLNGLPLTILRISAPYGKHNRRKTVINKFIENAIDGEDIILLGNGKREQDFMYVKDISKAFWLATISKKYGIYNIASGNTINMQSLANKIIKLTNSNSKIKYSGSIDHQENIKVEINILKAKEILNFEPDYSLDDGLKDCIDDYYKSMI